MRKKGKKILIYLFILLLLIFLLPGIFIGKIRFTSRTEIAKPLSSVYVTLGDPSRLSHWMSGFEKIEHLKGMPFCEGSTYRLGINMNGKKIWVTEEIVKITWKKHLVLKMSWEKADMLADLYFFYLNDHTVIEGTYVVEANSLGMRFLLPWLKPVIKNKMESEMEQFRKMMESSKSNP